MDFFSQYAILNSICFEGRERSSVGMKVLFCNIAFMKYYRGAMPGVDMPVNLSTRSKAAADAVEQFNFSPCDMDGEDVCLGYFSSKASGEKNSNQTHIEKIPGVDADADVAEDVLVIWCAKKEGNDSRTVVVGWYKHAKVYRYLQEAIFGDEDNEFHQLYNVSAKAEDCVLLPVGERSRYTRWNVPKKKGSNGPAFGFGTSNVWFATEELAQEFVDEMRKRIDDYYEDNLMYESI